MIFFEGIIVGFTLALVFGFGPAFFTLIQTSINRGFKSALLLDIGIIVNDMMIVGLMLMSSLQINLADKTNLLYAGLSAGIILIIFGIYTFNISAKKIVMKSECTTEKLEKINKKYKEPKWFVFIGKGFIMNIFNPFVWIFWMTCVATASGQYDGDKNKLALFFAGTFMTVFFFDVLKSLGAYSLKRFFTEKMMTLLNKITGSALICCGIYLIIRVVFF